MKEQLVEAQKRFSNFWDRRGFVVVTSLCFLIIGLTAWFTKKEEAEPPPAPSSYAYTLETPAPKPVLAQTQAVLGTPAPLPLKTPVDDEKLGMTFSRERLVHSKTMGDYRLHQGIDYLGGEGAAVRAMLAGTVKRVYEDDYLGQCILLEHQDGIESLYASLSPEVLVHEGDRVSAGQVIGLMGQSSLIEREEGYHVHVELYQNGKPINPRP